MHLFVNVIDTDIDHYLDYLKVHECIKKYLINQLDRVYITFPTLFERKTIFNSTIKLEEDFISYFTDPSEKEIVFGNVNRIQVNITKEEKRPIYYFKQKNIYYILEFINCNGVKI